MASRVDIIIFGASGFTGKLIISNLIKLIKSENISLTWGVAGRDVKKLKRTLQEIEKKTGENYSKIPIIYADVTDINSLEDMTVQARLIINAVGPYIFLGEEVVKACVKSRTHHIDVTAEPQFMETIQLKYHRAAMEKGIYLISACGFDCIPADLGTIFVQKNFEGTLNSIEGYFYITEEGGPHSGALMNYTTFESAIFVIAQYNELRKIRQQLFTEPLPQVKPELVTRGPIFKSQLVNKWSMKYFGSDRSVMKRTQRFMYETYKKRPIQIQTYCCVDNIFLLILIHIAGFIFILMCKFSFTRYLLLQYPKFFTYGMFSHEGPTKERQNNICYNAVFRGEGWSEKLPEPTDNFTTPPNKTITTKVSGKNGYAATSIACALSAIVILTENEKLPNRGGCYSPGAAFANTSIIEKLNKYGMKFELNPQL